ncbi:insulinase family protein, partial [Clostridioides difficile]|uniref:insulinase family protein n=1 Tax=Clostridioides difficile TaxID=1496 RepID=UPI002FE628A0
MLDIRLWQIALSIENIIGTKESLYNITRESMLEYLNKYYIPNNAVISIAGNFNFDDM